MVAVPVAPVRPTGLSVTVVSLPTGYSTMVYVPSGFWTACVFVTVVVCTWPLLTTANASKSSAAPHTAIRRSLIGLFLLKNHGLCSVGCRGFVYLHPEEVQPMCRLQIQQKPII